MNNQDADEELPEIRKSVTISAPIEEVWKAVSTADGIKSWWMPNNFEPVEGREFVLYTDRFGDSRCLVTRVDVPNRIEFDWDEQWHVTFTLKKIDDLTTEFTLIHTGWPAGKLNRLGLEFGEIRKNMEMGWERLVKETLPNHVKKS